MHVRATTEQIADLIRAKDIPHNAGPVLYTIGQVALRDDKDNVRHEERVTALAIPSAAGWLKILPTDLDEQSLLALSQCTKVTEIGG